MSSVEVRGRDEVIFGGGSKAKIKDPQPTPEIQAAMEGLDGGSTAQDYKTVGNLCFGHKMFSAAIKHYSKAIEKDPNSEILYSNRSASYLQSVLLSGPSMALKDANKCIELKKDWFKGYLRKGDALFAKKQLEDALQSYIECLNWNPDCTTAQSSITKCQTMIETEQKAKSPEKAPYSEEAHGQANTPMRSRGPVDAQGKEIPPEEERLDTETLIKTWSKDQDISPDSKGAFKKYSATVEDADRESGKATKNAWLSSFRKKVDTDSSFKENLEAKLEGEKLAGDGYNYKSKNEAKTYTKGTDSVGLAISSDAYRGHNYSGKSW